MVPFVSGIMKVTHTSCSTIMTQKNEKDGHAIRIIGYGSEKGQPYWIIANTWGEKWGESGFFRMKRGTNEGGIETEGVAGIVDIAN